jgi:hypothetical protein
MTGRSDIHILARKICPNPSSDFLYSFFFPQNVTILFGENFQKVPLTMLLWILFIYLFIYFHKMTNSCHQKRKKKKGQ